MSGHVKFVVKNVALRQVFSECFGFPCQFSLHQMVHTHISSGAGTIGQLVVDVLSGLSLTPPQEIKTPLMLTFECCLRICELVTFLLLYANWITPSNGSRLLPSRKWKALGGRHEASFYVKTRQQKVFIRL
jgi:hypothetical protein